MEGLRLFLMEMQMVAVGIFLAALFALVVTFIIALNVVSYRIDKKRRIDKILYGGRDEFSL
jgi:ABC-type phosphate/phosphonate transport system permease subunit